MFFSNFRTPVFNFYTPTVDDWSNETLRYSKWGVLSTLSKADFIFNSIFKKMSYKETQSTLTSILELKSKVIFRSEFMNVEKIYVIGLERNLVTVMAYKVVLGDDMCFSTAVGLVFQLLHATAVD